MRPEVERASEVREDLSQTSSREEILSKIPESFQDTIRSIMENEFATWFRKTTSQFFHHPTVMRWINIIGENKHIINSFSTYQLNEEQILIIAAIAAVLIVCALMIWPPWPVRACLAAGFYAMGFETTYAFVIAFAISSLIGMIGSVTSRKSMQYDMALIISGLGIMIGYGSLSAGYLPVNIGLSVTGASIIALLMASITQVKNHSIGGATTVMNYSALAVVVVMTCTLAYNMGNLMLGVACAEYNVDPNLYQKCISIHLKNLEMKLDKKIEPQTSRFQLPGFNFETPISWTIIIIAIAPLLASMSLPDIAIICGGKSQLAAGTQTVKAKKITDFVAITYDLWDLIVSYASNNDIMLFSAITLFSLFFQTDIAIPLIMSIITGGLLSSFSYMYVLDPAYKFIGQSQAALLDRLAPDDHNVIAGNTPDTKISRRVRSLVFCLATIGCFIGTQSMFQSMSYAVALTVLAAYLMYRMPQYLYAGPYLITAAMIASIGGYTIATTLLILLYFKPHILKDKASAIKQNIHLEETPRKDEDVA